MNSATGVPFKRDPKSGAVVFNNVKERKDQKIDKTFKDHLHKEVQFLADCANWSVDDYTKKIGELNTTIADLQTTVTDLKAQLEASVTVIEELRSAMGASGTTKTKKKSAE